MPLHDDSKGSHTNKSELLNQMKENIIENPIPTPIVNEKILDHEPNTHTDVQNRRLRNSVDFLKHLIKDITFKIPEAFRAYEVKEWDIDKINLENDSNLDERLKTLLYGYYECHTISGMSQNYESDKNNNFLFKPDENKMINPFLGDDTRRFKTLSGGWYKTMEGHDSQVIKYNTFLRRLALASQEPIIPPSDSRIKDEELIFSGYDADKPTEYIWFCTDGTFRNQFSFTFDVDNWDEKRQMYTFKGRVTIPLFGGSKTNTSKKFSKLKFNDGSQNGGQDLSTVTITVLRNTHILDHPEGEKLEKFRKLHILLDYIKECNDNVSGKLEEYAPPSDSILYSMDRHYGDILSHFTKNAVGLFGSPYDDDVEEFEAGEELIYVGVYKGRNNTVYVKPGDYVYLCKDGQFRSTYAHEVEMIDWDTKEKHFTFTDKGSKYLTVMGGLDKLTDGLKSLNPLNRESIFAVKPGSDDDAEDKIPVSKGGSSVEVGPVTHQPTNSPSLDMVVRDEPLPTLQVLTRGYEYQMLHTLDHIDDFNRLIPLMDLWFIPCAKDDNTTYYKSFDSKTITDADEAVYDNVTGAISTIDNAAIDTAKQVNKFFTTGKSEATKPDTVVEEDKSNKMVAQGGNSKYFSLQYGGDEVSEVGNKVEDKVNENRIPVNKYFPELLNRDSKIMNIDYNSKVLLVIILLLEKTNTIVNKDNFKDYLPPPECELTQIEDSIHKTVRQTTKFIADNAGLLSLPSMADLLNNIFGGIDYVAKATGVDTVVSTVEGATGVIGDAAKLVTDLPGQILNVTGDAFTSVNNLGNQGVTTLASGKKTKPTGNMFSTAFTVALGTAGVNALTSKSYKAYTSANHLIYAGTLGDKDDSDKVWLTLDGRFRNKDGHSLNITRWDESKNRFIFEERGVTLLGVALTDKAEDITGVVGGDNNTEVQFPEYLELESEEQFGGNDCVQEKGECNVSPNTGMSNCCTGLSCATNEGKVDGLFNYATSDNNGDNNTCEKNFEHLKSNFRMSSLKLL